MKRLITVLMFITLAITCGKVNAEDWERIENLRGYWKFNIGDNPAWADKNFDDSDWEKIFVPASWENEGFHGYNGYAWYRTTFTISENIDNQSLYLLLGYIDDVDEVYLNGKLVGSSGTFPPDYNTAYNVMRRYPVSSSYFDKKGENVIAVRVYDSTLEGGILYGDVGLYTYGASLKTMVNLSGKWKFAAGDNKDWKDPSFNDSDWDKLMVPGYWDVQGYKDYDGFGWYRKSFEVSSKLLKESLVLVLGKIDDIDEVYLNGVKVGSTGEMYDDPFFIEFQNEYSQFRGYYLNSGVLKEGTNVIAVRVYDGFKDGGIYEGPLGLVKQSDYRKYWKEKNRKKSIFDIIFGD